MAALLREPLLAARFWRRLESRAVICCVLAQAYLVQRDTKREQLEEVIEAFLLQVEEEDVLTR